VPLQALLERNKLTAADVSASVKKNPLQHSFYSHFLGSSNCRKIKCRKFVVGEIKCQWNFVGGETET
jgi:hypothetical protein